MKVSTLIGVVLIAVAVAAFAYQGITYTTRVKVVDVGPIHLTSEKTNTIPITPVAGTVALVIGVVLIVAGKK